MATSRQTRLKASLENHKTILENLYATMAEAASSIYQRVELDTGEGEQDILEKRLDRIQEAIEKEESIIDSIERKLAGRGLVALNNRRR